MKLPKARTYCHRHRPPRSRPPSPPVMIYHRLYQVIWIIITVHGFVTKSENYPPPFSAKRRAPVRGEVRAAYSMMRLEKREDGEGGAYKGGGPHGDVVSGDREGSDCEPAVVNRQGIDDVREKEGKRKASDGSGRGRTFGNRRRREGTPDKVRQDVDDGRSNPIPYKVGQHPTQFCWMRKALWWVPCSQ